MYLLHLLHYALMYVIACKEKCSSNRLWCMKPAVVIWTLYINTCGSSSLLHGYKRCTYGHTWTCRYPDFKVLTLLSPCGCLVGVIYMYNDGSIPNNHQSLSGSNFISSVIFRQQHAQYTLRLAMEVVTLIQDWEHQMYTFGTVLTTGTSGASHWHQTGWS